VLNISSIDLLLDPKEMQEDLSSPLEKNVVSLMPRTSFENLHCLTVSDLPPSDISLIAVNLPALELLDVCLNAPPEFPLLGLLDGNFLDVESLLKGDFYLH
jgi:hypothetical protein